jgi:hypothetical protein
MKQLELEFVPPEGEDRSSVRIILNPVGESPTSGLPTVTFNCKSMDQLEAQLEVLQIQLGKIRKEGAKFFKVPIKEG